ncbi:glutamate receptor ionotropic, kainate 2-like isoform X1 [Haliotis rufescens]|uniref:glutamate receptor ionotropic, kainate 2-like isoform X1 n=2 Tax=Haliotis rufescens TaxID=6454 RepID=UPI001EB05356|nr:glutamate receptor ionotropic, kainate 2-like isoform X1 [Haliotis rufescens]XP_046375619.1 glutamate receptor ionotropic, kainate 2-like isoform X1 [Haliotis rufescens]
MGRHSTALLAAGLVALVNVTAGFQFMINASVMGYPASTDVELYREIADILLREENPRPNKHNYCAIHFGKVTFDTTNGSTMYRSLTAARRNFQNHYVAVAIGPYIDVFTSTNYVILNQRHMLTSSAGQKTDLLDPEMILSILPERHNLSEAVSKIVEKLGWKYVALLSQDDFSTVLNLGTHNIQVSPIRLPSRIDSDEDVDLVRNLMELRASQKKRFILHSTKRDTVMHVMRAAKRLHLLHHTIQWLVDYPDFEDIVNEDDESWPGSIFGLQLLRADKIPTNISHVADQRNMTRLEVALAVDVVGLLRHVLYTRARNCSQEPVRNDVMAAGEFSDTLARASPYQGALGQYMWYINDRSNYSIDVLHYEQTLKKVGQCTFINETSTVNLFDNFTMTEPGSKSKTHARVEKLRVVARLLEPFVMKNSSGDFEGFNVDLLYLIAQKVNFTYEIIEVTDTVSDGEMINGMVQELLTGNASMAVGALEVTAKMEEDISFSYTILSTKASILVKKGESTRNFFQFLGPFSIGLWFMILGFIMVAGTALYTMSRFDYTQENSEQRFDLKESLWYSINVLLQGTTEYSPQTTSMRTIIAFFWFCVLIIDAAYTANLAAYLTLQQIDDRVRTVYDLAGQTEMLYGVENNSNLMTFFKDATVDPYERMWAFMKLKEEQTMLSNTTKIIELVKDGKYAFIADRVVNDYHALQHCGLESIEQNFGQKDFSLGFPRGAPYKDDVNRALLSLKEEGKLDTLTKKWWKSRTNCTGDSKTRSIKDKTTKELELTNMFGVFIVLGSFVVLSVIVEIIERITICVEGKKKQKKEKEEVKEKPKPLSEGFQPPAITEGSEKKEKSLFADY